MDIIRVQFPSVLCFCRTALLSPSLSYGGKGLPVLKGSGEETAYFYISKKVDDKLDSRSFWVGEPSAFESRLP